MNDDALPASLPASLAAAWGIAERPGRGPKPGLDLDRIVAAAVKIAATDGLAAVSMSRVASELGASTMSLYRYVAAKDELLALMLDAGTGPPPEFPDPSIGWREGLKMWAHAERAAMLRSPWVVHLPISGPPITPHQMAWLEQALRFLGDTKLTEDEKLSVVLLLSGFVWRDTTLAIDIASTSGDSPDGKWPRLLANYSSILNRLADPAKFPALRAALDAGIFDRPGEFDDEFRFGLERVLDGIGVLVAERVLTAERG
jgi:AcrR family transcriptional regulator